MHSENTRTTSPMPYSIYLTTLFGFLFEMCSVSCAAQYWPFKGGSTLVTLPRIVTPYRDGVDGWLRHCATSQKVAGSIPDGVIGIFH